MKKSFWLNMLVVLAVCLLTVSCSHEVSRGDSDNLISVRLVSVIADEKSISTPEVNDTMASWTYSAVAKFTGKASGEVKSASCDLKDGATVLPGFSQGLWEFTVYGFNSQGVEIYRGSQIANITSEHNTVTVFLGQYYDRTANGKISFDLCAPAVGSAPKIVCMLTNSSGTDVDLSALTTSTDNGNIKLSGEINLLPGLYTLTVSNYDEDKAVGGQLITFKVIKNDDISISGNVDFGVYTSVNLNVCTFSGHLTTSSDNTFAFVADTAHQNSGSLSYSWYVNGVLQSGHESSFKFTQTAAGYYSVTCVATYSDTNITDITSACSCFEVKNQE